MVGDKGVGIAISETVGVLLVGGSVATSLAIGVETVKQPVSSRTMVATIAAEVAPTDFRPFGNNVSVLCIYRALPPSHILCGHAGPLRRMFALAHSSARGRTRKYATRHRLLYVT